MDIWTKRHIRNYCSDPSEANDSKYSKYYQRIRRAIRKEDEKKIFKGNNKTLKIKNIGKSFFMSCWLKGPTNLIVFEISIPFNKKEDFIPLC